MDAELILIAPHFTVRRMMSFLGMRQPERRPGVFALRAFAIQHKLCARRPPPHAGYISGGKATSLADNPVPVCYQSSNVGILNFRTCLETGDHLINVRLIRLGLTGVTQFKNCPQIRNKRGVMVCSGVEKRLPGGWLASTKANGGQFTKRPELTLAEWKWTIAGKPPCV